MKDYKYPEFAKDVFITACEGGINYWADVTDYNYKSDRDWSAKLSIPHWQPFLHNKEDKGNSFSVYTLDWWIIMTGIARLIKHFKDSQPESYSHPLIQSMVDEVGFELYKADKTDDYERLGSMHDVEWADIIVQYGLFDELVYG
jgi:spermidine/putrescine-binding protein